jgi:nucleotide-binding universal stress UspA family protein
MSWRDYKMPVLEQVYTTSSSPHKIKRILYTTDLSSGSDEALGYAVMMARVHGARLFLCHCLETSAPVTQIDYFSQIDRIFKATISSYINPTNLPLLEWESIMTIGDPAKAIVREAIDRQVDLIIMRSRKRPYASELLGSIAESVCSFSPCPILVIHPNEQEWTDKAAGEANIEQILVAFDFSEYSKLALCHALSLAQTHNSKLHLIHVLSNESNASWSPLYQNPAFQWTEFLQFAIQTGFKYKGKLEKVVVNGDPAHEILAYAGENNIDLIFVGAHGKWPKEWWPFGSTSDIVLRRAKCPVYIARSHCAE